MSRSPQRDSLIALLALPLLLVSACGPSEEAPQDQVEEKSAPASRPERFTVPEGEGGDPEKLLARAINALGGAERLRALKSSETRFEAERPGFTMRGRIRQEFPDRFRQEQEVWDASIVHVSNGKNSWKSLDGVPMKLEEHDRRQLEEQVLVARMSLLVDLLRENGVQLKSRGKQDGHEWLEVVFEGRDLGPYHLGFDEKTSLLGRAHYETFVYGHRSKTPVTLEFSDHRSVSGIMVPFEARFRVQGEELVLKTKLTQIILNPEPDDTLFAPPESTDRVITKKRKTQPFEAVFSRGPTDEAEKQVETLEAFLARHDLVRTGPVHVIFPDAERTTCRVACPIVARSGKIALPEEEPITHGAVESVDVLTMVISNPTDESLKSAEEDLREEARRLGVKAAEGAHRVYWSESIVQVQLPLQ